MWPEVELTFGRGSAKNVPCLVEHSLGVVPLLFALCIAHRFTSLGTLARYDEPGLIFGFENFYSALLSGLAPFLYAAQSDEFTKDKTVLSAD